MYSCFAIQLAAHSHTRKIERGLYTTVLSSTLVASAFSLRPAEAIQPLSVPKCAKALERDHEFYRTPESAASVLAPNFHSRLGDDVRKVANVVVCGLIIQTALFEVSLRSRKYILRARTNAIAT